MLFRIHRFFFTRLAIFGRFLPGLPGCGYPAIFEPGNLQPGNFYEILRSRVKSSRVGFGSRVTAAG